MNYSTSEIAKIVGGHILAGGDPNIYIDQVCFDSRKIYGDVGQAMFIALTTTKNDGHHYIADVAAKGVCAFLVSKDIEIQNKNICFIKVLDVLDAIQKLATYHRNQFEKEVIGVTGSNAKTIVKEWTTTLVCPEYRISKSPRSYNSQLGVAISLLDLQLENNLGIFEAGISAEGEMQRLQRMIQPTIGVFTNIGDAHQSGFKNMERKVQEKLVLFKNTPKVILCADHDLIYQLAKRHLSETTLCIWSYQDDTAQYVVSIQDHLLLINNYTFDLGQRFRSAHEKENLVHAIVTALELGLEPEKINTRLTQLQGLALRLELKEGDHGNQIIDDSYVLDIDSMRVALDFAKDYSGGENLVLIISEFEQTGSTKTYKKLAEIINRYPARSIYAIGKKMQELQDYLEPNIEYHLFPNQNSLLQHLKTLPIKNGTVLIKGARRFRLERVSNFLSKKNHQAFLEVNLSALDHNLDQIKTQIPKSTKLIAVVKADAYGTGSDAVSKHIQNKVDQFAVAYIDEGVQLRKAGISKPIIVLNPEAAGFDKMSEYRLEPEIYHIDQLMDFISHLDQENQPYPIHVMINTGMNRLGFKQGALFDLCRVVTDQSIQVASIFSHLAAADDPAQDSFTKQQISVFDAAYREIESRLQYHPMRHVLNSAGIMRFQDYEYEAVRLGMGMYGVSPVNHSLDLNKVHVLKARISQINHVDKGESVGYGHNNILKEAKTIATINIGYADGLLRALGNGNASFYILGFMVPTIGNICMDMTMVDITHTQDLNAGMEIEIFGNNISVTALAKAADTISYEILSRLSSRIKKTYIME